MQDGGLNKKTLSALRNILANYTAIEQAKLYGSRAKGTYNKRSDIDLVVYGKNIDRALIANILLDLDESDIPSQTDLQAYHEIKNQQLIEHINRVGLVIYKR